MIPINFLAMFYHANYDFFCWSLIFHISHDSYLFRLESFLLIQKATIFDLILRDGTFSLAKIIKDLLIMETALIGACILIESVRRLSRAATNFTEKPRNSSICFFT